MYCPEKGALLRACLRRRRCASPGVGSRKASAEPRPRLYCPSRSPASPVCPSHERQAHLIKTKSTPNIPRAIPTGGRS
jgi:hypothetical protein